MGDCGTLKNYLWGRARVPTPGDRLHARVPRRDAGGLAGHPPRPLEVACLRSRRMAPSGTRGAPIRLGLFYAALYITTGVYSPYIAVWFRAGGPFGRGDRGDPGRAAPGEGGDRAAAGGLGRIGSGFGGRRFSSWRGRRPCCSRPWRAFEGSGRGWGSGSHRRPCLAPARPLADVIVLRRAAQFGFPYAFSRGIGSAAYIVGNVGAGRFACAVWRLGGRDLDHSRRCRRRP